MRSVSPRLHLSLLLAASLSSRLCAAQDRGASSAPVVAATSASDAMLFRAPAPAWVRPLGFSTLAAGVAGLGVGVAATAFAADHLRRYRGLRCRESWRQNPECIELKSSAEEVLRPLQIVGFAAGAALTVTGVALLLYAHEHRPSRWLCAPGVSGVQCAFTF